ncbi:hypothetical protein [Bacillus thuringiensis]|nr:hypothetical protein [Bacillus thuringiensis]MDH4422186.1 hypothetical protein [Bacillus cereus]
MKKLISKLKSFAHAPLNKNHCLRMKPFTEFEGLENIVKILKQTVRVY